MKCKAKIREYKDGDKRALEELFNRFQDYLVAIDKFGILQKRPSYGKKYFGLTLKSVSNGGGKIYVALDKEKIVGTIVVFFNRPADPGAKSELRGRVSEFYVEEKYRGAESALS